MRRTAFTLVELLTAIGIIIVLVALAVWAFKYASAPAKRDSTRAILNTLRGMANEFEVKGGRMRMLDFAKDYGGRPIYIQEAKEWAWTVPIQLPAGVMENGSLVVNNPDLAADDHPAFAATINVYKALLTMGSNQAVVNNLPHDRFIKVRDPADRDSLPKHEIAMPTDAWGNPILYAPRKPTPWPMTDTAKPADRPPEQSLRWGVVGLKGVAGNVNVQPPDGKGLWISAGPDGDFSTHDDNIYSTGG